MKMFIAMLAMASATPLLADPAPQAPAASPTVEKMICKSHVETGSLVARKKTCLTKSQWKYMNEQNEAAARKMVEDNQSRPSGN